jgi:hypothetical protein
MDMVIRLLGLAAVVAVVAYVLYSHWQERYGDNRFQAEDFS